jgi:putative heme-binding domain-containing protein
VTDDPILTSALIFALIQILDAEPAQADILHSLVPNLKPGTQTGVLVALDQTGHLKNPEAVWSLIKEGKGTSRPTALWILSHHPEWGASLVQLIQKDPKVLGPDTLGLLARSDEIANLLGKMASPKSGNPDAQRLAMEAMAQARLSKVPSTWVEPIALSLAALDNESGLRVVKSINGQLPALWIREIETIIAKETRPATQRLAALAILPPGRTWEGPIFELLVSGLHRDRSPRERTDALTALSRGRMAPDQFGRISSVIPTASPADIGRILDLFSSNRGEVAGLALVESLKEPAIVAVISPAMARAILDRHGPKVREAAGPILAKIEPNRADEAKRIAQYYAQLPKGDSARGHLVFNGQKAACAGCHKLGYVGGDTGPDLSRIGQIRSKADLLESILAPSASFVRSYEPVVVTTKAGRLVTGIIQSEGPEGVQLAVGPAAGERISRDQIEELSPGKVSLMPAGLEKQLTTQEMADLLEFLLQRK